MSEINIPPSQIKDLILRKYENWEAEPVLVRLCSQSLSLVILNFPLHTLNVALEFKLESLKVWAKEVSLEGNGSTECLELRVDSINPSASGAKILAGVRKLTAFYSFIGFEGTFTPSCEWDSLVRLHLIHFHEKALNSILERAPSLQEAALEGTVKEERSEAQILSLSVMWLRMLKVDLFGVKEIKLPKGANIENTIVLKGRLSEEVSIVKIS